MEATASKRVAAIIRDAGGRVVGRTRLQKIAYLLDVAGYGDGFEFRYRHFGPYSDEVAASARSGALPGVLTEKVEPAFWGGVYSIYQVDRAPDAHCPKGRCELSRRAADADAIELELAATAVFLHREGHADPKDLSGLEDFPPCTLGSRHHCSRNVRRPPRTTSSSPSISTRTAESRSCLASSR